ncbi:hypothetical protein GA0115240_142512 [Streptomyces sp. DvalAA-14]|uniref:hypothetical protein n=1 Tax=unclassified Streptomyces TaxID=2593676 RepID=UPI00081B6646|nr:MULTISPECIES: hypothetical protein [unclassified Streptomyces]MYS22611.1 hypothetical protein [Streptomyces sp. SID4948]SCE19238.1 hypothetical protein GA0115240_142512 [Streptomyces sp. DvalAA-14]
MDPADPAAEPEAAAAEPAAEPRTEAAPQAVSGSEAEAGSVSGSEAETVSGSGFEPRADSAGDTAAESPVGADAAAGAPAPAYKPRRRGRTTALIAAAAVLGVVAGAGVGYRIQQQRVPTPLPPLTGPMLAQPKGPGPAVPALPVSQDRAALYDSDLLKLLVPVPKGGKDSVRTYVSMLDFANEFTRPADEFTNLADQEFQRVVHTWWRDSNGVFFEVELSQFRDETTSTASNVLADWMSGITDEPTHGESQTIPTAKDGYVWPSAKPQTKAGYLPEYEGRGLAGVGNIIVQVYVNSTHKVKASTVTSLIDQQLERL